MDQTKMEEFVANAALLAGHLTQQCERAAADQRAASASLEQAAAEVGKGVAAGRAELAQTLRGAVRDALTAEVPSAVEAIAQSGDRLQLLADQLERSHAATAKRIQTLAMKALGATALASLAILGATGYMAWTNVQRAERAQVRAEVMEALEHVTITACDGAPCIKLEDGAPRWSKNADYILVDTSATP